MEKKEYIINAEGKRLGHIATEAASILLGKNTAHFAKNIVEPVTVKIENASKLDINEKRSNDTFQTFSGYPSGRKVETLAHLAERRGYSEVVRRVVSSMLPKNRLHTKRLQNLVVTE